MKELSFALIDCNSFYCSCERIFRPELEGRPVIVLSNNDGCAIARTPEAKALGIKMGDPFFKIKKFCEENEVSVFSSNFALYTNISSRVMNTIIKECAKVQVYSVDEAFADFSGIENKREFGLHLKTIIKENIGIPVGVGIGPTKVLAKLANHIAKKSTKAGGVVDLSEQKWQDVALKMTPIEDVWGIGRASASKLSSLGIRSAYDFKVFKDEKLIKRVFTKVGLQIKHELMGIPCFDFEMDIAAKKEIMCSRTFGNNLQTLKDLKESMANYISSAAQKMRGQNSMCTELSIFARTNPHTNAPQFYLYQRAKLVNPTSDTRKLIAEAFELLERSFKEGYQYRKAGVKLSNFHSSDELQIDLFSPADSLLDIKLMNTIDHINSLEGDGAIKLGACGISDRAWRMNREYKSPRYTTSWDELPKFM
ncbi:hypothetical protein BIY24_08415 [Halobacteriovorax marinus]|uniref:DNA repair protein n=1 Tax=Halobacteriovorax marinus (strain ATCC BAA-682 / DSM 15412 / SJ) TaxID=862908 RepID=E1X1W1_HALMS|nr:Y-family DNA polymerase [Halobacteriovorax marinus]ATH07973.1 hypothetical protein BIY24_08415 [Halobacteriovorax marinus]CBW26621.1 putative DNA repair protein [Halobacteriovorax marinus SJ]